MPRLVREMIEQAVAAQPDMVVVGDAASGEPPADVVVCGVEAEGDTSDYRRRLAEQAAVPVVEVGVRDGRASTFTLHPLHEQLGEVTPAEIVAAIRSAIEGRRG